MQIVSAAPLPPADPDLKLPPIHLRILPVTEPGAIHFLRIFGPECAKVLTAHCREIIAALYPLVEPLSDPSFPTIHSIAIYIQPMDGVAYTKSGILDEHAKEIHCSAQYFGRSSFEEISGVLIHELVHVWQRDGVGSAPGGFIEGLADYVRWKAGLGAAHWKKSRPEKDQTWDAGYERTAWFLEWVEDNSAKGDGWLKRVNMRLAKEQWGDWVWHEAGAENVEDLWKGYIRSFDPSDETLTPGEGPPPALPTHSV